MLKISPKISIPSSEFEVTFSRSSGPGGQNVNKVSSKVTLRWNVASSKSLPIEVRSRFLSRYEPRLTKNGEVLIHCDRFRDQPRNKAYCFEQLKKMIQAVTKPPKKRIKTKPSKDAKEKRIKAKKVRSKLKRVRSKREFDD